MSGCDTHTTLDQITFGFGRFVGFVDNKKDEKYGISPDFSFKFSLSHRLSS